MKNVLILGATSGIAEAFAHATLKKFPEAKLTLVSRSQTKLEVIRADLRTRYQTEARVVAADLTDFERLPVFMESFDGVLIAHGSMDDETVIQENFSRALPVILTNYLSPIALCSGLLPQLKDGACLAVISSVAGDRGRPSNFIYGSAKAGLQAYLSGLRAKLYSRGVHVLDVRPGFVSTALTAHLDRSGPLWAKPDRVAADILSAMIKRRDVLYTPWFWCGIMFIIRSIPGFVFKRLKL